MNSRLILASVFLWFSLSATAQYPSKNVGKDTCGNCHSMEQKTVAGTPHDSAKGCEGCHGSGEEHLKSGDKRNTMFSFRKAAAMQVRERCGQCHTNLTMSRHAVGDVSCLACHSSHHYLKKKYLLGPQQDTLDHSVSLGRENHLLASNN